MYTYKAKLMRVVDGDTVDAEIDLGFGVFMKQRIRLYGINTPESRTRDLEEKERGLAAKARLTELLGKEFIVETILNKRGKFGRILGTLHVNKDDGSTQNINQTLVEEGHAVEYFGGSR
jgi:micrococcal nuclease|tara:strand:- start:182 stop:538 length:357 start_codon:yes stop_codon:yes gene_type:complete